MSIFGQQTTCQKCGALLGADARQGFCPQCLFAEAGAGVSEVAGSGSYEVDRPASAKPAESLPLPSLEGEVLPRKFGDFELLEVVARGGMGIVYRARQVSLDRIVALKMLLFGSLASAEFVKRFRAEASAAASLQHPNIVAIHEVGVNQGQQYFAMDYVEGRSLARVLATGPLPAMHAARYLKTIAEAIHYAHERGILHRDLKPSNVLIDANDQPRVTDFGLARRLEGDSELTMTGQVLGSPNYMPPEQAAGRRGKLSRRSDVYSLGAMLYHLLTGRPPFVGGALADTLEQVLNVEPVSPRLLNPSVPRDLETICLKCVQKEPDKRFATARMLAEELGRFVDGKPIQARPVRRPERVWRWCLRKPALASTLAAALLLLFAMLIGGPLLTYRINQARKAEKVQAQRARQNQYASDINLAQQKLAVNNLGHAEELLKQHRPEEGQPDLRGWEWRYLWHQCQSEALFSLCVRSNPISSLALSTDGQWLAIGEMFGGGLSVWNLQAGVRITGLAAGSRRVCAAFSPRSTLLAFSISPPLGAADGEFVVRLWDAQTQKTVAELPLSGSCQGLAFSEDGHTLFTSSPREIAIWAVPEGSKRASRRARQPGWDPAVPFALAPDLSAAAHATPGDEVRVIDLPSGKERWSKKASVEGVKAVAFSPDGKILATGAGFSESDIRLWDAVSGREISRLEGHSGWIAGLIFWPNSKRLASASGDQAIRIWDLSNLTNIPSPRTLRGHRSEVWRLALLPDNRTLISGGKDGRVLFWDTSSTNRQLSPITLPETISTWRFSSNSQSVVTVNRDGQVVRWSGRVFQERELLLEIGTNFFFRSSLFSDDCRILATGSDKGVVELWDLQSRSQFLRFTNGVSPQPVAFLGQGKTLITVDPGDGSHRAWDLATGKQMSIWGASALVWSCDPVFSPDERWCFTLGEDGMCWLRDMLTERDIHADLNIGQTKGTAFSPDGRLIAGASSRGFIRLWDALTLRQVGPQLRGLLGGAVSVAFSPDGARLAVGGGGSEAIKIWDVKTSQELLTLAADGSLFYRTAFSPDGNLLGSLNRNGLLHLWRAPSWDEIFATREGSSFAASQWSVVIAKNSVPHPAAVWPHSDGVTRAGADDFPVAVLPRDPHATSSQIDLSMHYNRPLGNGGLEVDVDNDLSDLSPGMREFGGTVFDVRGIVGCGGLCPSGRLLPAQARNIRVRAKCRRIHCLQATLFGDIENDVRVGSYVLHYADGQTKELPLVYGKDLRNWWTVPGESKETSNAFVVWTGTTPLATDNGQTIRLWKRTYENPRPDVEITHLDFVSAMAYPAPFVVAITVE